MVIVRRSRFGHSPRALLHSRHVVPIAHSAKFDYRLRLSLRMTRFFFCFVRFSVLTRRKCKMQKTPHHPTPSGASPGGEAFQSITHAKLTLWSNLGGGTKLLAGAILPSACERKKFSRVCSARWLTPSAEQKNRECYESDSRRGYAIKMR